MKYLFLSIIPLLAFSSCAQNNPNAAGQAQTSAASAAVNPENMAIATFAGGCFWCTEEAAEKLIGVADVVSGYTGGHTKNPTYEQIGTGTTGHAEAIQIHYDSTVISYATLLDAFFAAHDPTTLNRQGPDVGTQYRSAIFYNTPAQKAQIDAYIKKLNASRAFQAPIVTQVAPLKTFYPAEAEHQDFYLNNPNNPYMRAVSKPKLKNFEQKMEGKLKKE